MTAAFRCGVGDYFATSANEKLGALISAAGTSGFSTERLQQVSVWETELAILGRCAAQLIGLKSAAREWHFLLEYKIPRRGKRPDLILLANDLIIVIEFKIGPTSFTAADDWQVYSYSLDLRDFHAESSGRKIVPLLVVTGAPAAGANLPNHDLPTDSAVMPVERCGATDGTSLATRLLEIYNALHDESATRIDVQSWDTSAYKPSPSIIEAAETLFAGHSVADISHSFATNLQSTSQTLIEAIEERITSDVAQSASLPEFQEQAKRWRD